MVPNPIRLLPLPGLALATLLAAAPPGNSPFQAGRYGRSRLEFVGDVPVMHLYGTPVEMGEAAGRLTGPIMVEMAPRFAKEYLALMSAVTGSGGSNEGRIVAKVMEAAKAVPAPRMAEMKAMAKAAGVKLKQVILANLLPEVAPRVHCSTFTVSAARMSDKEPAFGRNLDYPNIADIARYGLVVVYHEKGRIPLASFTFPGLVGVLTGMNAKGLCGATMDEYSVANRARVGAIPRFLFYRELLSRYSQLAQVHRAIQGVECLSGGNFTVMDARGWAAVLESPGAGWHLRLPTKGMVYASNHFRCPCLVLRPRHCSRYATIARYDAGTPVFTPRDVKLLVKRTAQHAINVQAMVMRPKSRQVFFAYGRVPAVLQKFRPLKAAQLFPPAPARPVAPAERQVEDGRKGK